MKLFQYAVIYVPNEKSKKSGKTAAVLVEPTTLLAKDQAEATFKAARSVPQDYAESFDELEVAVRPF